MNIVFRTEDGLQDAADCLLPALRADGLYRDIVVVDTDIRDWRTCLDGLHRAGFEVSLSRPFHVCPPWHLAEIFNHVKDKGPVQARVALGQGITAGCDFDAPDEIEIYIDPFELTNSENVLRVLELITTMGRSVGKEVCLCQDGGRAPSDVIASCDWKAERLTVRRGKT